MPDKNVTIRELARAAGVSIGTVSRALKGQSGLSEQTRGEVLRVAQQLGYDVGKLRTGKLRRLLVVYSRHLSAPATNVFFSIVLHGAEAACRDAGVSLGLLSIELGDDLPALVRRHEAEGLVGIGHFEPEMVEALRGCDLPLVLAVHFNAQVHCVNEDSLTGALMATRHLLAGGAQRPAMIIGPLAHNTVAMREKGFRRALFEAGRLADPELEVVLDLSLSYEEAGRQAMQQLLALPQRPDAVFAYNDETALYAMAACEDAGLRVPEDIRFVGYDNIVAAARSRPPLSTVAVDKEALGREAVQCVLEGRTAPGNTLLPVELLVRESSRTLTQLARALA